MTAKTTRRAVLGAAAALAAGCKTESTHPEAAATDRRAPSIAPPAEAPAAVGATLGKTGAQVEPVSLGGEGVLRTTSRANEAVPVIEAALELGVRYCDTAPAYQQSQDYYGLAFRNAPKARDNVFLASKTHLRDREGALRLLDESLERLGTDRLDLWQLHDLRSEDDLDRIFGKGGAIEAVEAAKADGRVRHVGITGHHSPAVLVEAMRRYPVDTVLCAINPADRARDPFITTVVAEARARGVGVVGMKVFAAGRLLQDGFASPETLIRYAGAHCDTMIIGCSSAAEVKQNLAVRAGFEPLSPAEQRDLEARAAAQVARYSFFKAAV